METEILLFPICTVICFVGNSFVQECCKAHSLILHRSSAKQTIEY